MMTRHRIRTGLKFDECYCRACYRLIMPFLQKKISRKQWSTDPLYMAVYTLIGCIYVNHKSLSKHTQAIKVNKPAREAIAAKIIEYRAAGWI